MLVSAIKSRKERFKQVGCSNLDEDIKSTGDRQPRVLLPEIQAFFESEEGQREFAEWKAKQQAEQENKA